MLNIKIKLVPYETLREEKFVDVLKKIKEDTILLIDAKLDPDEELHLIKDTMQNVNERFSGIELGSLELTSEKNGNFTRIRNALIEKIIGKKRGPTIVGPASIIHKIKKNPKELMLYI
jgi:hypothetical protein